MRLIATDISRRFPAVVDRTCRHEVRFVSRFPGDARLALRDSIEQPQASPGGPAGLITRRQHDRGAPHEPRRVRRSTRENPAGLTGRELEVLTLVASGLRNAEIAARLVVSEKTVDHHVSAVLRKLDVRSRGQASVQALRRGIVPPPPIPPLPSSSRSG